ncbi:MAG: hypothetical protein IJS80_04875 [Lachnospiraceae bacterium]|nr:hypothetical protein [Lachnospiraceae bacterium]
MKTKKIISRILAAIILVVMVTGIKADNGVFASGTVAVPEGNIVIDYDMESVIIDETSLPASERDTVIYFTDIYTNDISKWYCCELRDNVGRFDFSWARTNADVKIYICGDYHTKISSIVLQWQETLTVKFTGTLLATDITDAASWKAKYAETAYADHFGEDTGYFVFSMKVNNREQTYLDLENIEWRKGTNGNWHDYSELDPHEMEIRGGALEFRIKSVSQEADPLGIGNRHSSVTRYTLAKILPGPIVNITYTDGTVNIKNGQEFSLNGEDWTLIPAYATNGTTTEETVPSSDRLLAIEPITTTARVTKFLAQQALGLTSSSAITSPQTVYVRNAGSQRAAASRITEVTIPATGTISDAEFNNITVDYVPSKSGNGGIQVSNANDSDFQVAVITPKDAERYGLTGFPDPGEAVLTASFPELPVTKMAWTTLKANSYTKIAYSRAISGSIVVVRKTGTREALPSPYRICSPSLDYSEALTYASISGSAKLGYTLTANPSSNMLAKLNSDPGSFDIKWEYASSKNATDWTEIDGVGNSRTLNISDSVPDGATYESVYAQTHLKYVRVTITYNGRSVTSTAVGFVN